MYSGKLSPTEFFLVDHRSLHLMGGFSLVEIWHYFADSDGQVFLDIFYDLVRCDGAFSYTGRLIIDVILSWNSNIWKGAFLSVGLMHFWCAHLILSLQGHRNDVKFSYIIFILGSCKTILSVSDNHSNYLPNKWQWPTVNNPGLLLQIQHFELCAIFHLATDSMCPRHNTQYRRIRFVHF